VAAARQNNDDPQRPQNPYAASGTGSYQRRSVSGSVIATSAALAPVAAMW
jgi:hypothetical protein